MSDQWFDDDNDSNDGQQQGKGLRAQLEAALKKNRELEQKLQQSQKDLRREAVTRVIRDKGFKAKVAKLVPADVDPTDEAITKWLDEWGDVFGVDGLKEPEQQPAQRQTVPDPADELSNAEYAQQLAAMGATTATAQAPVKDEDLMKRILDPNTDRKALMELINAHGGGVGVG